MQEDEGFIMRPIDEGMCSYESAVDGTLGLVDFARMNEWLDIKYENQARVDEAYRDRDREK